jgi:hypothetical protein
MTRSYMQLGPLPLLLVATLLAACGEAGEPEVPAAADPAEIEVSGELTIIPSPLVAPDYPDARVGFEAPAEGATFAEGEAVEVRFHLSGYQLQAPTPGGDERGIAQADGQHLHFILNNERYQALYDAGEPVVLDDLPAGYHVLRAFPGTDWHESVKTPGAFAMRIIQVGDVEGTTPPVDPDGPFLTYSRPVGEYSGQAADSILVDFHLSGVRLHPEGHRVRLTVEGVGEAILAEWRPYLVVGLPNGSHTFRLELLDAEGRLVPGDFNRTERVIEVDRAGG